MKGTISREELLKKGVKKKKISREELLKKEAKKFIKDKRNISFI
jgi:hypothetical protein